MTLRLRRPRSFCLRSALIWIHCRLTVRRAQEMSLLTPFVSPMCRLILGTGNRNYLVTMHH